MNVDDEWFHELIPSLDSIMRERMGINRLPGSPQALCRHFVGRTFESDGEHLDPLDGLFFRLVPYLLRPSPFRHDFEPDTTALSSAPPQDRRMHAV